MMKRTIGISGFVGLALAAMTALSCTSGQDPSKNVAYFEFRGSADNDRFVIKLMDPQKIEHARNLVQGKDQSRPHVAGIIVKAKAPYNPSWNYYLKPESIDFFDVAIEVCDANMRYVEEHLSEVGGAFLPGSRWCPWSSTLTREISLSQ